jgi:hypothetical protein
MAIYGALYGAIGVIYGFGVARFWLRAHERPCRRPHAEEVTV